MEFSVGSVLSRAFKITSSDFAPLVSVALVVYVPLIVLHVLFTPSPTPALTIGETLALAEASPSHASTLLQILDFVAGQLVSGAIAYGVFQRLRGRDLAVGDSLSIGFQRLLPVIGVALLVVVLLGVGLLLFLVPGLILMCVLYVAIPAAVVERPGVIGALSRSAELTRGHRWTIFGIVLVLMILGIVVAFVVGGLFVASGAHVIGIVLLVLVSMVLGLLQAVTVVVAYHDLRVLKEGISTEEIASVFD